jgi:tetratricopeptide (TPR) repeat protein
MTRKDWQIIDAAVAEALQLDPAQRETFLTNRLVGRDDLLREARSLLAYDGDDKPDPVVSPQLHDYAGERVGPYRITGLAGEGGMGVVWSAERDDGQFQRRVAVKFLSGLMPSGASLDRFLMERDILSTLDHTNIAGLLDAGFANRTPYLVMEWVEGKRIDDYCRDQGLHPNEILRLFLQVCDAVEYAHRALVVHRDLKPSNLLVTAGDQVKLLDFGIAKMLDPGHARDLTGSMSRILTPEYASPEHIRGERVTTSTDVYSLGIVLYELLTGMRPFDFTGKTLAEIVENAGRTRPPALTGFDSHLSPEIDAIVLKALQPHPDARYGSVAELSADIENYLAGRPVQAKPAGMLYVAGKFVRRHRMAVAAVTLAVGLIVGTAIVATQQRIAAERRFAQLRQLANAVIFDFQEGISSVPGTLEVRRQMVRKSLDYLDSLAAEAGTDLDLRLELAKGYQRLAQVQGFPAIANLGDFAGGLASARKARREFEIVRNGRSNDLAVEDLLGQVILLTAWIQERVEGENFKATRAEALQYAEALLVKHPDTESALSLLASALFWTDMNRALAIYEKLAARYPENAVYQRNIALMCRYLAGKHVKELATMRKLVDRAIEIDRRRVQTSPLDRAARLELSFDLSMLGSWHEMSGQVRQAANVFDEVRSIRQDLVHEDARDEQAKDRLLYVLVELARLHSKLQDSAQARGYYQQAVLIGEELSKQNSRPNNQFEQSLEAARKGLKELTGQP